MNTNVIGPQVWRLLDTWAKGASQAPQLRSHFSKLMLSLRYVFPCRQCRESLLRYFSRPEVVQDMAEEDPLLTVYRLHADVNERTGRAKVNSFVTYRMYTTRMETMTRCASADDLWDWFSYITFNLGQRHPDDVDIPQLRAHIKTALAYSKAIGLVSGKRQLAIPAQITPRSLLECICEQYRTRPTVEEHVQNFASAMADRILLDEPARLERVIGH